MKQMDDAANIQNSIDVSGLRAEYEDMVSAGIFAGNLPSAINRLFTKTMMRFWLEDPKKQALSLSVGIATLTHMYRIARADLIRPVEPRAKVPDGPGVNARIAEAMRRRCLQNIDGTPVDD